MIFKVCIPAKKNAEFCAMKNVLSLYKQSYDKAQPLVCMDESSKQMLKETRNPASSRTGEARALRY